MRRLVGLALFLVCCHGYKPKRTPRPPPAPVLRNPLFRRLPPNTLAKNAALKAPEFVKEFQYPECPPLLAKSRYLDSTSKPPRDFTKAELHAGGLPPPGLRALMGFVHTGEEARARLPSSLEWPVANVGTVIRLRN
eukprot:Hpha_TRINITY_DN21747_c0_g1::TRINITY_DN21747_c0_g1_i1::g.194173::m.194173